MTLTKKNKPWTLEDSAYAWDQHVMGRTHKFIARRLSRTEKAIEINLSKTRVNMKLYSAAAATPVRKPRKTAIKKVRFSITELMAAAICGAALGVLITYSIL